MNHTLFLHNLIHDNHPDMHQKRRTALLDVVNASLNDSPLAVNALGRRLEGEAKVKHKIKKVDRLMSNPHLARERVSCYSMMTRLAIGSREAITVLVDWSPCPTRENQLLRASLVLRQRSITLYEEVHPEAMLGKWEIHQHFLQCLSALIPRSVHVTVVTDAGFRVPWFKLVLAQGWDFEGRVRGNRRYSLDNEEDWQPCRTLFHEATHVPQHIGNVQLTRGNRLPCHLYSYHDPSPTPTTVRKKKRRSTGKKSALHRKAHQEPWLLATSVPPEGRSALQVVKTYAKRMKIEHEFRDLKDPKSGIGLRHSGTRNARRLELLLLIGALALFILWAVGLYGEHQGWQYSYQANTIKHRRVLSLVFLGIAILRQPPPGVPALSARLLEDIIRHLEVYQAKELSDD